MLSNTIFYSDQVEPTDTEIDVLRAKLSDPLLVKYIKYLKHRDLLELVESECLGIPAELVARNQAYTKGLIAAYDTLLSISINQEEK